MSKTRQHDYGLIRQLIEQHPERCTTYAAIRRLYLEQTERHISWSTLWFIINRNPDLFDGIDGWTPPARRPQYADRINYSLLEQLLQERPELAARYGAARDAYNEACPERPASYDVIMRALRRKREAWGLVAPVRGGPQTGYDRDRMVSLAVANPDAKARRLVELYNEDAEKSVNLLSVQSSVNRIRRGLRANA